MSNNLLWKELHSNQVNIKDDDIVIDELFQIIGVEIDTANYIFITISTPLNYANTYEFTSHHSSEGKYFHNKQGEIIRFMLDPKKCIHIDEKHDRLRRAIFDKR